MKPATVDHMAGAGPGQQIWALLVGAVLSLRRAKALYSEKPVRPLESLPGRELGRKAFTCGNCTGSRCKFSMGLTCFRGVVVCKVVMRLFSPVIRCPNRQ